MPTTTPDTSSLPDRAEGEEELVTLFVTRKPVPADGDPDIQAGMIALGKAFVTGVAELTGADPADIHLLTCGTKDVPQPQTSPTSVITGAELLALP